MRIPVWALAFFPLAAAAAGNADLPKELISIKPVACQESRLPPSALAICQYPELRRQDVEINSLFRQLLAAYQGQDRKVFAGGQIFWRAELLKCRGYGEQWRAQTEACVRDKMSRRFALLMNFKANPGLLSSTVADYTILDPWYVQLFPEQFEGKSVTLRGVLLQDSALCANPRSRKGRLKDVLDNGDVMDAEFSADVDLTILCTGRSVFKEWDGTVKLDGQGRPYLYLTKS